MHLPIFSNYCCIIEIERRIPISLPSLAYRRYESLLDFTGMEMVKSKED
jgi:hypothetical protein